MRVRRFLCKRIERTATCYNGWHEINGLKGASAMGFFKKLFGSADAAASPSAEDISGKKPFSIPIDAVDSIPGRGTVVIGTVGSGIVRLGDNVQICGDGGEPLQSMVARKRAQAGHHLNECTGIAQSPNNCVAR